jgi:hypothetical protein
MRMRVDLYMATRAHAPHQLTMLPEQPQALCADGQHTPPVPAAPTQLTTLAGLTTLTGGVLLAGFDNPTRNTKGLAALGSTDAYVASSARRSGAHSTGRPLMNSTSTARLPL